VAPHPARDEIKAVNWNDAGANSANASCVLSSFCDRGV
jgi:hypothetical protein